MHRIENPKRTDAPRAEKGEMKGYVVHPIHNRLMGSAGAPIIANHRRSSGGRGPKLPSASCAALASTYQR